MLLRWFSNSPALRARPNEFKELEIIVLRHELGEEHSVDGGDRRTTPCPAKDPDVSKCCRLARDRTQRVMLSRIKAGCPVEKCADIDCLRDWSRSIAPPNGFDFRT
jgi:hypothetical protein